METAIIGLISLIFGAAVASYFWNKTVANQMLVIKNKDREIIETRILFSEIGHFEKGTLPLSDILFALNNRVADNMMPYHNFRQRLDIIEKSYGENPELLIHKLSELLTSVSGRKVAIRVKQD